jgi:hypothetical protein
MPGSTGSNATAVQSPFAGIKMLLIDCDADDLLVDLVNELASPIAKVVPS